MPRRPEGPAPWPPNALHARQTLHIIDPADSPAEDSPTGKPQGDHSPPSRRTWFERTTEEVARSLVRTVNPFGRGARASSAHVELADLAVPPLRLRRLIADGRGIDIGTTDPPVAGFEHLRFTVEVAEKDVNGWAEQVMLPVRFSFDEDRIRARSGLAGVRVSSVDVALEVSGGWLRLRPTGSRVLGTDIPFLFSPQMPLPLPRLPYGMHLIEAAPGHELLRLAFEGDRLHLPM